MLKEEKMKKISFVKILSIILIFILSITSFADEINIDNEYFNGIIPSKHINIYSFDKSSLPDKEIRYNDIELYVHYNNPEVLNYWNSWESNKSSEDVYEDYLDLADRLYDSAAGQDSELQEGIAYAQADAMRIQADKNISDSYINFLNYYLSEKQLIYSSKVLFLNYNKSIYEVLNANEKYEEAMRKEEQAINALEFGNGTELDLLNAKKAVSDAKSAVISAESKQKSYFRNLLTNCGKTIDDSIKINDIDLAEFYNSVSFNLEVDYQTALNNNVKYEVYKRSKNNARTEEVKKEYDVLVEAAPKNIYNDLDNKYSTILDAFDTIQNKNIALKYANDSYAKAQNEYKCGSISEKEYNTIESNLRIAKNNIQIATYDYCIAIENYKLSIEGYGNA